MNPNVQFLIDRLRERGEALSLSFWLSRVRIYSHTPGMYVHSLWELIPRADWLNTIAEIVDIPEHVRIEAMIAAETAMERAKTRRLEREARPTPTLSGADAYRSVVQSGHFAAELTRCMRIREPREANGIGRASA